ncbi:tyrosine-type recombinase/integrase [Leucobacter sp. W1038]|uniref:tyrosine-type recombinase/integrase n=1 Tax=Leucobacter sp. W1038 TaxID=3438281 RepID=UPI003D958295
MSFDAWGEVVPDFYTAQLRAGLAETTAAMQVRQLRSFGRSSGLDPWEVSRGVVSAYLEAHPGSVATVKRLRQTLRAFYRWGIEEGYCDRQPVPDASPVTRYTLGDQWEDAIGSFERAQAHAKMMPGTVVNRVKHLARFASDCERGPWEVSSDAVRAWLDSLTCSDKTRLSHRSSLRAFYRWAHAEGRVHTDPTEALNAGMQKLGAPVAWQGEIDAYVLHLRAGGRMETTVAQHVHTLARFARDHARLAPFAVTANDVLVWAGAKRWGSEMRRHTRSHLLGFYTWAIETGRCDTNPASVIRRIRPAPPAPKPANDDDYRQALAQAAPRERLALRLAAELGMRCAEVSRVHTGDVHHSRDGWSLTVRGKGNRTRHIPLTESLALELRSKDAGYVFPGKDNGHLSAHYLSKRISQLLPTGVTMHALRHRFATRAYNVDRDVFTVQQLLGHASPATTQRYVLVQDDAKRRLVELMSV